MAPKKKTEKRLLASVAPVPAVLADEAVFAAALAALGARDAAFAAYPKDADPVPALRRRAAGFEGLASIIVAQQVSTASANAIFGRLKARLADAFDAATYLALEEAELRACGLSAPKMRSLQAIAEAVTVGVIDFDRLAAMESEAAHAALVAIKGVGPWTADVFLLFCLGHADAWPAGDLALQEAARLLLGLETRPTAKELVTLGERWRPLRGVAAHCLWAYYRVARVRAATLDVTPPAPSAPRPAARSSTKPTKAKTTKAKQSSSKPTSSKRTTRKT